MPNRGESLQSSLFANLFGGEEGMVTIDARQIVDEICECVVIWLAECSGVHDAIERYYMPVGR